MCLPAHGRAEANPVPDPERPGPAVGRHLGKAGGEVGPELRPLDASDVVVAEQRADEKARREPERLEEVLAGRVEAVREVE